MELKRYENVIQVIKILDKKILKVLTEDDSNLEKLKTFIDIRKMYTDEYNGLEKGRRTHQMFNDSKKG
ncbi:hypothetical protein [Lentiprolixibacter aurantiacus]|uniref:Uncharacterized protein n=1 Tax=Lentiprolixibacter aurantiacus TaxID=2993939 RepID=A0AAE3MK50_9FLAO|nr:hypothetical protein [Lentiprolixibacter aurantiacus]MCX2718909.1 hypothetical protein [Lentiprolixibacter aurantiacus]